MASPYIFYHILRQQSLLLLLSFILISPACSQSSQDALNTKKETQKIHSAASIGFIGDIQDVETQGKGGFLLMGGGTDVDAAFKWMIQQAGNGDFVVIRATGTDAYNPYIYHMGSTNSVETLKINSRSLANDSAVVETIRNAEALFIAGGDQSDYVNFWKNTDVAQAINYLIHTKKAPVGGTSAGCAVLGEFSFSALNGTVYSKEALQNPFNPKVTIQKGGFIDISLMRNTITGQHYLTRDRVGRHITFMARIAGEINPPVRGIGVNEKTAVAVDSTGRAIVLGKSKALFLRQTNAADDPEILNEGNPLTWNRHKQAITAYAISREATAAAQFDLKSWKPLTNAPKFFYYVEKGQLKKVKF